MKLDLNNIKIMVIGDFMVDHYLFGASDRFSPEAPIPVVNLQEELLVPGGAGNVAMNLNSLGAEVTCVGFVGDDYMGRKLLNIFQEKKININHLELINNHRTTIKQRIYCESIQQSRLDSEIFFSDWIPNKSINYSNYDFIILSDYNKGVFHKNWFIKKDVTVALDPKVSNSYLFKNSDIITPNIKELADLTKLKVSDDISIEKAAKKLINEFGIRDIVVTRGDQGMSIISNNKISHIPCLKVNNPDVTGAGDTVIATLGLVYAKTEDIDLAASIANKAASIVVGQKGTTKIRLKDLEKLLDT
ncbi:PfkB family carbohydrate kinase [Candidatus Marinimicrobia bacterium]|nr:PfkB family carbohydrate kinase [Candidatus Neomarinimicrobiota bacterium]